VSALARWRGNAELYSVDVEALTSEIPRRATLVSKLQRRWESRISGKAVFEQRRDFLEEKKT